MSVQPEPGAARAENVGDAVPPPTRGALPRPRLWELLDGDARLTVLRAPTGFGKSTLLRQWAHRLGHGDDRLVWIDGDDPGDRRRVATAADEPTVLVWDHFDTIADGAALEAELLDALRRNPAFRLILAARSASHFPDALRLELRMTTIRSRDLAFQRAELQRLFSLAGAPLDPQRLEQLDRLAQGWPKPMSELAMLLASEPDEAERLDGALAGIARRFLSEEVVPTFATLADPSWIDFVLASAVPSWVSASLARTITDDAHAGARLDELAAQVMLTVSTEGGERAYRWPGIMRTALLDTLRSRDPARLQRLHERAAAWFDAHGHAAEALENAHTAQDWPGVVRVVERHWSTLMYENFAETRTALRDAPASVVATSIAAAAIRDIFLLRWRVGDELLLDAARGSRLSDPAWMMSLPIQDWEQTITDATAVMIALRTRGEMPLARRFADSADALLNSWLGAAAEPGLSLPSATLHAMLQVGVTRMFADDHDGAVESLRRTYRFSPRTPGDPSAPNATVKTALASALVGDAVQTEQWLARGDDDSVEVWPPGTVRMQRMIAAAIAAIERGDAASARALLGQLENRTPGEYIWETAYVYARSRYDLVWGDRRLGLRELARERERLARWFAPGSTLGPLLDAAEAELFIALGLGTRASTLLAGATHARLLVPRARLAVLTGQDEEVVRLTTAGLTDAGLTARDQTQLQSLQAVAQARLGERRLAAGILADALTSTDATGARLGIAAAPRTELLDLAAEHGLGERLAAVMDGLPEFFPRSVDVILLTARERTVLHELANGRTIREIADASFLSQNTIKSQLRSLYMKLGASSRERAVALAHQHRLLDDARYEEA